jgi:translation initiation factor IF-1
VSKDDHIEFDGVVTEVLTGGMFRVKIDDDHAVIAHLAGKMRKFRIKVVLGDRVKVPYGRLVPDLRLLCPCLDTAGQLSSPGHCDGSLIRRPCRGFRP